MMNEPDLEQPTDSSNASCLVCNKEMRKDHLQRHMKIHQKPCRTCDKIYRSTQERNIHQKKCKPCRICKEVYTSIKERNVHEKDCRQNIRTLHFEEDFLKSFKCQTAINNRFKIFTIDPVNETDFLESIRINLETVKRILMEVLKSFSALKFYIVFEADMRKEIYDTSSEISFYTKTSILLQDSNIDELLQICHDKINDTIEKFSRHGSGWILNNFTHIHVHVTEYSPCSGGNYLDLPYRLKMNTALLNIRNDDEKCIIWCLLAAIYPTTSNSCYTSSYKEHFNKIKITNVSFPVTLQQIPIIEENNKLRINVYGYRYDEAYNIIIFPLCISSFNYNTTISLLLISDEDIEHYVLIKDFNGLLTGLFITKTPLEEIEDSSISYNFIDCSDVYDPEFDHDENDPEFDHDENDSEFDYDTYG